MTDLDRIEALAARARGLAAALADRRPAALPEADLLSRRLAPDMLSLAENAVVLADGVVGAAALLAGRSDHPRAAFVFNRGFGSDFGALPADLAGLAALFASAEAEARPLLADASTRPLPASVTVRRPGQARRFETAAFVKAYVLPNGDFHLAIVHAIARAAGVPVGKGDFEGPRVWTEVD